MLPASRPLLVVLAVSVPLSLCSVQAVPASVAFKPFAGQWKGALEYQDYGGTGRVKIPVLLEVKPNSGSSARWNFVYDDFGRTVNSFETHSLTGPSYKVVTEGQKEIQMYSCPDFVTKFSSGVGKAVLMGRELENGVSVEVRRTVTLTATMLTTLKETRPPGGKFSFRNQSTYTRVAP